MTRSLLSYICLLMVICNVCSFRVRHKANHYANRTSLPVPQSFECAKTSGSGNVQVDLNKKLGAGDWGEVYKDARGKHAIKVEVRAPTQHTNDLNTECQYMIALLAKGIMVPNCVAFCQQNDHPTMVMDFLTSAKSLPVKVPWQVAYQAGKNIYDNVAKMVKAGYGNVDQTYRNIMIEPDDGTIWFIDMGMAKQSPSSEQMDAFAFTAFCATGYIKWDQTSTVPNDDYGQPRTNFPALEGLRDAFAADVGAICTRAYKNQVGDRQAWKVHKSNLGRFYSPGGFLSKAMVDTLKIGSNKVKQWLLERAVDVVTEFEDSC